uniref:outer membrane beta-barrel protein n=1 Tax=Spirosoma sp. SC4-14 TaxID=3128900 RepID=UPI00403FC232
MKWGQAGYLLSANSYHSSDKEKTFTAFQHTNKIDAGLTGGVGYRLGTHLVADLRYYYGMRPLRENYTAADPQTGVPTYFRVEKWYNRVWLVNLTYYC